MLGKFIGSPCSGNPRPARCRQSVSRLEPDRLPNSNPVAAATARVSATKAFELCSKENIQTHGGNGFTWEYDCHLFYKRSKLLSLNIGSLGNWKEKLVSNLEKSNIN